MATPTKQQIFKRIIKNSNFRTNNFKQNEQFWSFICSNFDLPEEFIRQYKDIINWEKVSRYQHLSIDFVREFKRKIDWEYFKHTLDKKEKREFNFYK